MVAALRSSYFPHPIFPGFTLKLEGSEPSTTRLSRSLKSGPLHMDSWIKTHGGSSTEIPVAVFCWNKIPTGLGTMMSPIERLKVSILNALPGTPFQWNKIEVSHVLQTIIACHPSPGVLHLFHSMNAVFKHQVLGSGHRASASMGL